MKNFVYIIPGPSNPEGNEQGHWKIMFEENGKSRHLNDAQDHTDAVTKAERTAKKRDVELELDHGKFAAQVKAAPRAIAKKEPGDYMTLVSTPRGAPAKGAKVKVNAGDETSRTGKVVDYLAEQFLIDVKGQIHVVHVDDNWEAV